MAFFKKIKLQSSLAALLGGFLPIASLFFIEFLQSNITIRSWTSALLNLALIGGVYLLLFALCGPRIGAWIGLPLFLIIGIANHYVIAFRGTTLLPWDIAAAKTAMNVIGNFTFSIKKELLLSLAGAAVLMVAIWKILPQKPVNRRQFSALSLAAAAGLFAFFAIGLAHFPFTIDHWNQNYAARENGYLLNFTINLKALRPKVPEGYSSQKAQALLAGYQEDQEAGEHPNIIVIMNEAFADLPMEGKNLSEDPLSFFHSLQQQENTVSGKLIAPVFGGGTCNTEYEFLTSHVCEMLRTGSYPLQQLVNDESPSIASSLKALGYHTVGIHPFLGNGWNRNRAYPLLGFDQFLTIEDFDEDAERMRDYITDRACYQKIGNLLKEIDEPLFAFAVTMQNHGGYTENPDSVPDTLSFDQQEQYPQTKMYLELLKESDQAIQELITALSKEEKKTILLFFGDHQPSLGEEYTALFPKAAQSGYEGAEEKYGVPFFLWANFDLKEEHGLTLSPNHLAPFLLEKAALPLSPYQQFVKELREEFPVISPIFCQDKDGLRFPLFSEGKQQITDYHILQYHQVFDSK